MLENQGMTLGLEDSVLDRVRGMIFGKISFQVHGGWHFDRGPCRQGHFRFVDVCTDLANGNRLLRLSLFIDIGEGKCGQGRADLVIVPVAHLLAQVVPRDTERLVGIGRVACLHVAYISGEPETVGDILLERLPLSIRSGVVTEAEENLALAAESEFCVSSQATFAAQCSLQDEMVFSRKGPDCRRFCQIRGGVYWNDERLFVAEG